MDISIIWEDPHILIVNKPPGLLSIQDGYHPSLPHLYGQLKESFGPLWIVHRLDKDTSGVMLFARTSQAHRELNRQFEHRTVHKEYHALVNGSPTWDEKEINLPLRVNGDRKHRTVVDLTHGKPAVTDCHVLERFPRTTLIAAIPHSGYTHQIRVHLSSIGHSLLGDSLYQRKFLSGQESQDSPIPVVSRTALHAFKVVFDHPIFMEKLTFQAPYPTDFQDLIAFSKK